MTNTIIETKNIHYKYSDGTYAIKGISLSIDKGRKIGIVGPNGAGKTTLFLILNGIYKPYSGEIFYNGEKLKYNSKNMKRLRSKIGIVFQDPNTQLFSSSVTEEISFGPLNQGLSEDKVLKRVNNIISKMNLDNVKDKPTHFLSGGEKKRVAIASILAMDPDIIIFDEPLANVDPKSAKEIMNILDDLNKQGKTIIISTHNVNNIYQWSDYVFMMKEGEIVEEGIPTKIFQNKEILEHCNLEKPWILEAYYEITKNNPELMTKYNIPKNKEEFFSILRQGRF